MRAIQALFAPQSVAVIGASARIGALGYHLMANLHGGNFMGPVLPVHPRHRSAHRILCYPSIDALPLVPELAVLCTPARITANLVAELAERGTRAAVVLTADPDGRRCGTPFKTALDLACRSHGLRLLGPGSFGVQAPGLGLNASLIPAWPPAGNLALVSQSGPVAVSVVAWAKRHGIGFSHVITTGDAGDLDLADLLDHLAGDMRTRAVLLYVRTVRDGQSFLSAARALARIKPLIAIRPRDLAAPVANGDPVVAPDAVYDAAFHRSGMLRVNDTGEWFDAVESLGAGKRHACATLAIVCNGGELGLHAAEPLVTEGKLAVLHPATEAALAEIVPSRLGVGNPVDLGHEADPARYVRALKALFADPHGPAVLTICAPSLFASPLAVAQAVAEVAKHSPRPLIACWMGQDDADLHAVFAAAAVPLYDTPETAARAFLHLVNYGLNQQALSELPAVRTAGRSSATDRLRLHDEAETPEMLCAYGRLVRAIMDDRPVLDEAESLAVLQAHGFETLDARVAVGVDAAETAALELGLPVELRAAVPTVVGAASATRRRADSLEALRRAASALAADAATSPLVLQRVANGLRALPLSLAIADHPAFGRVILLSCVGNSRVLLPPLNPALCEGAVGEILATLRAAGAPAPDAPTLQDVLLRLSDIVVALPELVALHCPSLLVGEGRIVLHDVRLRVAEHRPGRPHLAIRPYPQHLEERIALRTGRPVLLRPLRPEDDADYADMLAHVTPRDLFLRFCSRFGGEANSIPRELLARLVLIDYQRDMSFIAFSAGEGGRAEALGVVDARASADCAEAEFSILLRWNIKGTGLGRALMEKIIGYCRVQEFGKIVGLVLRDNQPMRGLCTRLGFRTRIDPDDNMVTMTLPLGAEPRG